MYCTGLVSLLFFSSGNVESGEVCCRGCIGWDQPTVIYIARNLNFGHPLYHGLGTVDTGDTVGLQVKISKLVSDPTRSWAAAMH